MEKFKDYELYKDIQIRTHGEIYLGVVGPVRTGKSTFIKRFMDQMVIPFLEDENSKAQAQDELPQSSGGKTITTTEPKFIPKEASNITLFDDINVKMRLIDCVGYMVPGAVGHMESNQERMVKTPWFDYEIPFTQAAEVGTDKVIRDHSTIGIVITTDGTFGELNRENYVEAEEKTIEALKSLHKPFLLIVNSSKPYSDETKILVDSLNEKYGISVLAVNCDQLKKEDIHQIFKQILFEFPISVIEFYMPKWVEMLPLTNNIKKEIICKVNELMNHLQCIRDIMDSPFLFESEYIKKCKLDGINFADGTVKVFLEFDETYYYEMLSDMIGESITSEYQLLKILQEFSKMRNEYLKVKDAIQSVRYKGYGVVTPNRNEIHLQKPEVIRHGNKYGVKLKAESPSIHMIRANIETEIAPIVGTEQQAQDLIKYISEEQKSDDGIWNTNIFGKTIEQLVRDGITGKIAMIGDESQMKLQETMQKIVNDSNGGLVCIII